MLNVPVNPSDVTPDVAMFLEEHGISTREFCRLADDLFSRHEVDSGYQLFRKCHAAKVFKGLRELGVLTKHELSHAINQAEAHQLAQFNLLLGDPTVSVGDTYRAMVRVESLVRLRQREPNDIKALRLEQYQLAAIFGGDMERARAWFVDKLSIERLDFLISVIKDGHLAHSERREVEKRIETMLDAIEKLGALQFFGLRMSDFSPETVERAELFGDDYDTALCLCHRYDPSVMRLVPTMHHELPAEERYAVMAGQRLGLD